MDWGESWSWFKEGGCIPACSSDKRYFEQEKKSPQKGSPRSRIPRLVLHPFRPKDKGSPLSDSPLSEEEGKECDVSSDHSKRTISTNSFCSGKRFSFRRKTAGSEVETASDASFLITDCFTGVAQKILTDCMMMLAATLKVWILQSVKKQSKFRHFSIQLTYTAILP